MLAELVPEKIGGLPAHPLLVHVPVVLIPLATAGAIAALVRPTWRSWMAPLVAVLSLVSLIGVQLAMESGESLEAAGENSDLIERHSQLAEQTRPFVVVFCIVAVAAAVIIYLLGRAQAQGDDGAPLAGRLATARKALVPLLALSVVFGTLSSVWVVRTGHEGAKSVWHGDEEKEKRGPGGPVADDEGGRPDGDSDGD